MSTMTLEQVRDRLKNNGQFDWSIPNSAMCQEMAEAIDALLREREAAKARVTDDLDYVPGKLDRTAPARIWLQIDTAAFINDRDEPWPGCDDVTWQDESVGGLEIQYVRADLVVPMLASARVSDEWVSQLSAPVTTELCTRNPAPHAAQAPDPTSPTIVVAPMLAATPCSLAEALNVLENWALHGNVLSGDDVPRFRAVADRIAPMLPARSVEAPAWPGYSQGEPPPKDWTRTDVNNLASARVPDGYVLVPKKFGIPADAWNAAQFAFGGPGTGDDEPFIDCTAWIGELTGDEGEKIHGLHIWCDECPEEGSITLAEFPAAPKRGEG